jgi:type IV pilus assembly protein PilM
MVSLPYSRRAGPIAVDVGSQSLKLLQLDRARSAIIEVARADINLDDGLSEEDTRRQLARTIAQTRSGRRFVGRQAVVCLSSSELYAQNIRVDRVPAAELDEVVREEAVGRLPFPLEEAEIRFLEAADVRQGDMIKREVILLACHRPMLQQKLDIVQRAGLRPVAVDVEPLALLRCYQRQYRRDEDKRQCSMLLHVGNSKTAVVIAQHSGALFIKYVDIGGAQFDDAVARHLKISPVDCALLRRRAGERRTGNADSEVEESIREATRDATDRLTREVSLCLRYHSVTFRGHPVVRVVLGGGEATPALAEAIAARIDVPCELGNPLRPYQSNQQVGRAGLWDVAAGLALKETD